MLIDPLANIQATFTATAPSPAKRARVAAPEPAVQSESDEEEAEDDAEEDSEEPSDGSEDSKGEGEDAEEEDGDEDGSPEDFVHESLKTPDERRKRENQGSSKYVPEDETRSDRDRRTIFVGNVPIECIKEKVSVAGEACKAHFMANRQSAQTALKAHIRSFVPTAKIESVRFRSVAFSKPVVSLPDDDDDAKAEGKRARREKNRAAAWRDAQEVDGEKKGSRRGEDEFADKSKSYLDAKGKRKVAFIKKDVSASFRLFRLTADSRERCVLQRVLRLRAPAPRPPVEPSPADGPV